MLANTTMKRSEVIAEIKQLERIAPRAGWVEATRAILMSEIRRQGRPEMVEVFSPAVPVEGMHFWSFIRGLAGQPVVGFVTALALVVTSGLTVNAAFYSLPGEPLYRVKIFFERTQLIMVSDSTKKVELKVEFARNRVKELEKLVSQMRVGETPTAAVSQAVSHFTQEVASVRLELPRLPAGNRAMFNIAVSVDQASRELAEKVQAASFSTTTPAISQAVRQALATADVTSQAALEAAVVVPKFSTTSQPLAANEVNVYLREKIVRLRALAQQLAGVKNGSESTRLQSSIVSIEADLTAAENHITVGNLSAGLAKISSAKAKIDALKMDKKNLSVTPDAKPVEGGALPSQERATSTTAPVGGPTLPAGPAETNSQDPQSGSGPALETTQNILPQ